MASFTKWAYDYLPIFGKMPHPTYDSVRGLSDYLFGDFSRRWSNDYAMMMDSSLFRVGQDMLDSFNKYKDMQTNSGIEYLDDRIKYNGDYNRMSGMENAFRSIPDALPFSSDISQIYGSTKNVDNQEKRKRLTYRAKMQRDNRSHMYYQQKRRQNKWR